jgi:hypothetical protein
MQVLMRGEIGEIPGWTDDGKAKEIKPQMNAEKHRL